MSFACAQRTIAVIVFLSLFAPSALPQTPGSEFAIAILSSRPDMVSGSDALVEISVPEHVALNKPKVRVNGQDVTSELHPKVGSHALLGLIGGLKPGDNSLEVLDGKMVAAKTELKNFAIAGPIFAGPQEHPFLCQTALFKLPDGKTLGEPLDANCSAKTVVTYMYKSTEPRQASPGAGPGAGGGPGASAMNLKPLTNLKVLPADVAMTTTTAGKTVPYIVRVETGTIDRSIYQFAVLYDPTKESAPTPLAPPKAWNGRLLYSFGGGCAGGWYLQGDRLSSVISDAIVGRGYVEAASTLNVAGTSCNDIVSAEVMMMIKEHIVKTIGKPEFTFGRGGSGGSYQQNQIADHYPGLLDGIIPSLTFPDVQELAQMLIDARLLHLFYAKIGDALTNEQKRAIAGVAQLDDVGSSAPLAGRINPTEYCPEGLAKDQIYDAKKNPKGVRCDLYDHNINYYGKDPVTGYARHPIDNTGVQYGLETLNAGIITPGQFLELNEKIGGYDSDGYVSTHRAVADPLAVRAAYQNDLVTYGKNLSLVPIIDVRPYRDKLPNGDNHLKYHSFSYRARLEQANGTYANEVMITGSNAQTRQMEEHAIEKMDEWLTALQKDTSNEPLAKKIIHTKPADLVDACWDKSGQPIIETQTFSGGKCNELYPTAPPPRMVAGASVAQSNILKCQLKPIDAADYKVTLSREEKARLEKIFPEGVCDWSKPGVEQQPPTIGPWHWF